jgi:hypothetical protein
MNSTDVNPFVQVDAKFPQKVDGQVTTIENKVKAGYPKAILMLWAATKSGNERRHAL